MLETDYPKALFILNPNSGKKKHKKLLREIQDLGDETTIRFSEYAGHSIQIVGEELENYDVFVAVGGDGTVSEIASALSGTGKKLAVYPTGSGNGFAREFGFNRNLNQLMKAIREQKSVACDVLSFNNQKSVNVSGIGFDSAVAVNFAHRKKRGFRNYVVSTLKNIRSFHPIQAVVKTDTEEISGEFFMLTVANTRQFGNNAIISAQSNPTDGQFEVILAYPFPLWMFPQIVLRLFLGKLKPTSYLRIIRSTQPVIISTPENQFHIDGEPTRLNSPVTIQIHPARLLVVDTGRRKF